jgi:hypothetical protein
LSVAGGCVVCCDGGRLGRLELLGLLDGDGPAADVGVQAATTAVIMTVIANRFVICIELAPLLRRCPARPPRSRLLWMARRRPGTVPESSRNRARGRPLGYHQLPRPSRRISPSGADIA